MALTQDQSEMLQTAVNNLNESVAVNKEVLEIVKSVGNTGAVDIAQHNNSTESHENGFNRLVVQSNFYIGGQSTTTEPGAISALRVVRDSGRAIGNVALGLYSSWDASFSTSNIHSTINNYSIFPSLSTLQRGTSYTVSTVGTRLLPKDGSEILVQHCSTSINSNQSRYAISVYDFSGEGSPTQGSFYFWPTMIAPSTALDLGSSTFKWKDCYLQNSPIVSSDRRLKQNFESVPEAVFKAWAGVNFQVYKFKEAVARKGEASARKHVGLVAQDIIEAFDAQGLNAFDYGIVCHDSWGDQYEPVEVSHTPAEVDEKGNVVTPESSKYENRLVKAAGDVYTVRYEEALALEAAYQRWKLSKIEQALAAKGITL